jgi:hypothetical protein
MSLLAGDVTDQPLAEAGGMLPVRRAGFSAERFAAWQIDPVPWRARLAAAAQHLGGPVPGGR